MKRFSSSFSSWQSKLLRLCRPVRQLLFGLILSFVATEPHAQTDHQRLMAVMSVITSMLLDRDEPIDAPDGLAIPIDLNQLLPGTYLVDQSQGIYAQFDLQDEGIEYCFDLVSNSPIGAGDITVEINGVPAIAVEGKDNCYQITEGNQREINYILLRVNVPGLTLTVTRVELSASAQTQLTLSRLTRGGWDEKAVRKVLRIFAFGGHATDLQIRLWADMAAATAIQEMLNFDEHNLKLSPLAVGETYIESATQHGTLVEWINFLSNPASTLPIPVENRDSFNFDNSGFDDGFNRMITVRGLNPFRQRIGFWETNFHLAVNLNAGVSRREVAVYYDTIMQAHEANVPYRQVLGAAAKSAAVAEQYGHDRNVWVFDRNLDTFVCKCNEDFAREIHQLFYGIFGENDPNHEDGTIPETAKMLTDMDVEDEQVIFGTEDHHVGDVTILGQIISGADASQKIDSLMPISMQHPESLQNLPVMIISVLADDNLSEAGKSQLRTAWASMGSDKNFLDFIQAYAISNLLHGGQHFKYMSSHERALFTANKNNVDNLEAFFGGGSYNGGRAGKSVGGQINREDAGEFFRPIHNVFGAQTSLEAANSALVFETNYNGLTDQEYVLRQTVQCSTCDLGQPWEKKWQTVLPQRADGKFYVEDVAPWLWNHVVGSLDNYTELERAHLYSLLGSGRINSDQSSDGDNFFDFNFMMCLVEGYQIEESATDVPLADILEGGSWDDYCRPNDQSQSGFTATEIESLNRIYTGQSIAANALAQNVLGQLGQVTLPLNSTASHDAGATLRKHSRERIEAALGFIFTTPFVFAEDQ